MTSVCFPAQESLSEKGSTLKGNNLLPWGADYFLLESTLFQKGGKNGLTELLPLKVNAFPLRSFKTKLIGC